MTRRQRYDAILEWFAANRPDAASELNFGSVFQMLVAVMLSAQCTDKRVNMVTPALFAAYPGPREMAAAPVEEIFELVRSVSYPNAKSAHLKAMAQKLCDEFGGEVPADHAALCTLPGVGRKTANVVMSIAFEAPVIAVDTHVFRVSHRIGLSSGKTPAAVEKDLTANIPPELRYRAHHWLLLHGRYVCTARKCNCEACGIAPWCKQHEAAAKKRATTIDNDNK